jgi:hypothetical protein
MLVVVCSVPQESCACVHNSETSVRSLFYFICQFLVSHSDADGNLSVLGCKLLSEKWLTALRSGLVPPCSGSSSQRRLVWWVVRFSEMLVTVYQSDTVCHPIRLESFFFTLIESVYSVGIVDLHCVLYGLVISTI